jgi:hypothetical protein
MPTLDKELASLGLAPDASQLPKEVPMLVALGQSLIEALVRMEDVTVRVACQDALHSLLQVLTWDSRFKAFEHLLSCPYQSVTCYLLYLLKKFFLQAWAAITADPCTYTDEQKQDMERFVGAPLLRLLRKLEAVESSIIAHTDILQELVNFYLLLLLRYKSVGPFLEQIMSKPRLRRLKTKFLNPLAKSIAELTAKYNSIISNPEESENMLEKLKAQSPDISSADVIQSANQNVLKLGLLTIALERVQFVCEEMLTSL